MKTLTQIVQNLSKLSNQKSSRDYIKALGRPEKTQDELLKQIMMSLSETGYGNKYNYSNIGGYGEFRSKIPIVKYAELEPWILAQMEKDEGQICQQAIRYLPTSGSTSNRKWIPFNEGQKQAFDRASSPWLNDISNAFPQVLAGRHYWSLSWLPDTLRNQGNIADDLELFPKWKKAMWQQVMAAPSSIAFANNSEAALFATVCYLCTARDLTLLSVWSPTFVFSLIEAIEKWQLAITETIRRGQWQLFGAELVSIKPPKGTPAAVTAVQNFTPDNPMILWPQLKLVSSWDSHSSKTPANKLKELFNDVQFQGKGLWATEGVVTIPFMRRMPLAVRSHFFEFRNLDNNKILKVQEIKRGMTLTPILTCQSGLVRYEMDDQLYCDNFLYQTPCFKFMGRMHTSDLCGEKLTPQLAQKAFEQIEQKVRIRPISLIAINNDSGKPYYHLIAEGEKETAHIEKMLDSLLCENHHYALARELGQLDSCRATVAQDALGSFMKMSNVSIAGAQKIEPLMQWSDKRKLESFFP